MATHLLLDLGNSRLKWAALHDGEMLVGEPVAHTGKGLGDLAPMLAAAAGVECAWISSTALSLTQPLCDAISATLRCPTRVYISPKEALGIRSAYDLPHTLGTDRFLAMVGARAHTRGAFLLVDAGTAVTLDMVDDDGQHLGGLIVPGPLLMREALHHGTAGIRTRDTVHVRDFASSTDDAVWSGGVLACAALIGHSWRQGCAGVGGEVELLLSGGALPWLEAHIDIPHRRLPHLVLDGLARWARTSTPA